MGEKELSESFDKEANDYDTNTSTFHHMISEYVIFNNLEDQLKNYKQPRILDAGCGTGKFAIKLLKKNYTVDLLDISEKSLSIAKKKLIKEKLQANTYLGSCENTPFFDKSYDFVMLNGAVISYTPNPIALLQEINRILSSEGIIWFDFFNTVGWAIEITDINYKSEVAEADNKLIQMPDWDYPARVMSLNYVRKILNENNFNIINEFGLINLSHSINLDERYSNNIDNDIVDKYKNIELQLSKNKEMIGSAWSCIICAKKIV